MRLLYDNIEIGSVMTTKSLDIAETLEIIGYDVKNEDDLKKAYEDKFPAAYQDDNGFYHIDVENIKME